VDDREQGEGAAPEQDPPRLRRAVDAGPHPADAQADDARERHVQDDFMDGAQIEADRFRHGPSNPTQDTAAAASSAFPAYRRNDAIPRDPGLHTASNWRIRVKEVRSEHGTGC